MFKNKQNIRLLRCIVITLISLIIILNYWSKYESIALNKTTNLLKISKEDFHKTIKNYMKDEKALKECKEKINNNTYTIETLKSKVNEIVQDYADYTKKYSLEKYNVSLKDQYENQLKVKESYLNETKNLENEINKKNDIIKQKQLKHEEEKRKQIELDKKKTQENEYKKKLEQKNENNTSSSSKNTTYVYIANGNKYYHKISSCKFLKGKSTQKVSLENASGKFQCNCWHY